MRIVIILAVAILFFTGCFWVLSQLLKSHQRQWFIALLSCSIGLISVLLAIYAVKPDALPGGMMDMILGSSPASVSVGNSYPEKKRVIIRNQSLAEIFVGQTYSIDINFDDLANVTDWRLVSGRIPSGMYLSSTRLKGIPRRAGNFAFTIEASTKETIYKYEITLTVKVNSSPETPNPPQGLGQSEAGTESSDPVTENLPPIKVPPPPP